MLEEGESTSPFVGTGRATEGLVILELCILEAWEKNQNKTTKKPATPQKTPTTKKNPKKPNSQLSVFRQHSVPLLNQTVLA